MAKIPSSVLDESYISNPSVSYYVSEAPKDSSIYDVSSYRWDGKSRPNVDDYTAPWIRTASQTMYKYTGLRYKKEFNAMVTYARNQLQAALAQYDADLALWNERDERDYTDQSSQLQRFEDAGFNMGYMYSAVDNGNSAVGYNQESAGFEPSDNRGDELGGVKLVVDCVTSALSLVAPMINSGISLAKLPHEIALIQSQKVSSEASARLANIGAKLQEFMQSHDYAGNAVESLGESLAFSFQQMQYDLAKNQSNLAYASWIDKTKWNSVADRIYQKQATPTASEAFNQWVYSLDMPDWAKACVVVLGAAVGVTWSGSVRLKNPVKSN